MAVYLVPLEEVSEQKAKEQKLEKKKEQEQLGTFMLVLVSKAQTGFSSPLTVSLPSPAADLVPQLSQ